MAGGVLKMHLSDHRRRVLAAFDQRLDELRARWPAADRAGGRGAGLGVNGAREAERGAAAATAAAAIVPVTVVVVMLAYAPALAAPFVEIKLAALVLGGALSAAAWLWARVDGDSGALAPGIAVAGAAVLLTTAASAAVAAARAPGVPYAGLELARWGAAAGVALGTRSGRRVRKARAAGRRDPDRRRAGRDDRCSRSTSGLCPLPIPSISVPGSTFGNRNIAAEAIAAALPFGLARRRPGGRRARHPGARFPGCRPDARRLDRGRGGPGRVFRACAGRASPGVPLVGGIVVVAAVVRRGRAARTLDPARRARRQAVRAGFAVMREGLSPSSPVARTRLGLWRRAWTHVREKRRCPASAPVTSAVLFPRHAEPGAAEDGVLSPMRAPRRVHDDLLERLTETGPLGLLALLALYAAAAAAVHRARAAAARDSDDLGFAAACAGSLAAVAGCGLTGFPLAMPSTVLVFGVALGGLAARVDGPARPPQARHFARHRPALRAAVGVLAVGLVVAAVVWPARRLAASLFLGRAERALAGDRPEDAARALADLARAARAEPRDFDVALRTAYAASRAGRPGDAIAAAERALAVEPDSPNGWEALARGRLEAGDPAGAAAAADHALALLHAYPGALYTRTAASRALGDEGAAARPGRRWRRWRRRIRRRAGFWAGWTGGNLRRCARASPSSTTGPCRCVAPSGSWNLSAASTRARRSSR